MLLCPLPRGSYGGKGRKRNKKLRVFFPFSLTCAVLLPVCRQLRSRFLRREGTEGTPALLPTRKTEGVEDVVPSLRDRKQRRNIGRVLRNFVGKKRRFVGKQEEALSLHRKGIAALRGAALPSQEGKNKEIR